MTIRKNSILLAWESYKDQTFTPSIYVGDYCSIGTYANISCINKIVLGKYVLIGRWVTIIDHAHGAFNQEQIDIPPEERHLISKGSIIIDDFVWIGDKVTICSNVHIHKCAVVGANSVVTKDVPEYTMVVGCPAKVVKRIDCSI